MPTTSRTLAESASVPFCVRTAGVGAHEVTVEVDAAERLPKLP
ncbi:MAG: hypothetical protein ACJ79S_21770 [Gemmatimonadaceae bacterium]